MQNPNLFLPGFHLATLRRKPRSERQKLADKLAQIQRKSISQLAKCFADFIRLLCNQIKLSNCLVLTGYSQDARFLPLA